jgi:hypothetical protein
MMRAFTFILCIWVAICATSASAQVVLFGLPLPVGAKEIEALIEQLEMNDTQAHIVRAAHARYWEKWQGLFGERGPECRRLRTRLNNFIQTRAYPETC